MIMYLLYIDESGTPDSADEATYVMGGVGIFERQVYFLSTGLHEVQREVFPDEQELIEFHASAIWAGKEPPWNCLGFRERADVVKRVYDLIANAHHPGVILFGVAVNKADFPGQDPVARAFEELCMRFDGCLKRMADAGNEQRSLLIFDDSRFRTRFEALMSEYKTVGTSVGRRVFNVVDVPLFTSSRLTRILQVADFVANALWRRYEHNDARSLDRILHRFDQSRGVLHGLVHLARDFRSCHCPACLSRRAAASAFGESDRPR